MTTTQQQSANTEWRAAERAHEIHRVQCRCHVQTWGPCAEAVRLEQAKRAAWWRAWKAQQ